MCSAVTSVGMTHRPTASPEVQDLILARPGDSGNPKDKGLGGAKDGALEFARELTVLIRRWERERAGLPAG